MINYSTRLRMYGNSLSSTMMTDRILFMDAADELDQKTAALTLITKLTKEGEEVHDLAKAALVLPPPPPSYLKDTNNET